MPTAFLLFAVLSGIQSTSHLVFESGATDVQANQIAEALADICPNGEVTKTSDGRATGCRGCPAGTAFQDERGEGWSWELRSSTAGHFTSKADNLLLSGAGCEPHSLDFGGSFLFILRPDRPELLTYNQGLITDHCHKLRADNGRDDLVCQNAYGGQGTTWRFVYLVSFEADGKSRREPIFTAIDTIDTCGYGPEGIEITGPVQHSEIEAVSFPDLNGDGRADLLITASLGKKLLTQGEREMCMQKTGTMNWDSYEPAVAVPTKDYRIEFLFDGKRFRVTPRSEATLELFPKPEVF